MPGRRLLLSLLLGLSPFLLTASETPSFLKTAEGIIVFTDPFVTGTVNAVRLEVIADNIIRVTASPGKELAKRESLITIYKKNPAQTWELVSAKDKLTLKTKQLTAIVTLRNGAVSFYDKSGKLILAEKQPGGRNFREAVFDGQQLLTIRQDFQSQTGEAYYGLGQHQDGVYNYKGEQVNFFQNNTEVAVPFLLSSRHYGILWDNYSLTSVGDVRPFHPLSSLRLSSDNGQEGWLTARYFNDKSNPVKPVLEKAEASINMEFLGDSRIQLPTEFTPASGLVRWEGSLESGFTGVHRFRFIYGGYLKIWVDGKLVLDRWRKAWNPAPALVQAQLTKGVKTAIKIEWIPDGGESYLAAKWQEPADSTEVNTFSFASEAGQQLDYYFIYGQNSDQVIAGYRTLTGKAPIVPKWALGFWQSRERYKTEKEILDVVTEYRNRKIPLDNIVLDWSYWKEDDWGSQDFDPERFPSPENLVKTLHEKYNTRFMISVWPKFYEGISTYQEFEKNGYLYKRNVADRQRDWIGKGYVSTFYDAFNENARKAFWKLINEKIYSKGVDAWWMDASEPDILSNVSPEKRKQQMTPTALGSAAEYLNAYPLQNAKGIYEGQRSVDPSKRVFLLTRSGFAGSQRYSATIWSGDIGATWHDMQAQIPAGINFSMSGLPYWTMDIGGFVVENRFEKPNEANLEEWRELLTRWHQFGAFVPLFRSHGQYPYREIYNTAPESHIAYQSMVYYNRLRYRLLPYIYSIAGKSYHSDYTMMRGLVMDFPDDKAVLSLGDQYMFGPSLLINPVYSYKQRTRSVYLPNGQGWYDLYSGKWYNGGATVAADAPYERMPVFVKEGSILPVGPELQYTTEKPADTITLYVYTGKDAAFEIYEDEGTNEDYAKGGSMVIPIKYSESEKSITIGQRKGTYAGMLAKRYFRVIKISRDQPKALDIDSNFGDVISYEGQTVKIKL